MNPNEETPIEKDRSDHANDLEVTALKQNLLHEAYIEADEIIKEAEEKARLFDKRMEEREKQVEEDAQEAFTQAKESGWEEGYQQGKKRGFNAYETELEQAKQIIELSKKDYYTKMDQAEPDILQLGICVAERIIGSVLEDASSWTSLVTQAVREMKDQEEVEIFVHPHRYEMTLQHKNELHQLAPHVKHVLIYSDPQLDKNGCTIETSFGKVDASVGSQLQELKDQLGELLRQGESNQHENVNQ